MAKQPKVEWITNGQYSAITINGKGTYGSYPANDLPTVEIIDGKVYANGVEVQVRRGASGVMDNRHRNWRRRG